MVTTDITWRTGPRPNGPAAQHEITTQAERHGHAPEGGARQRSWWRRVRQWLLPGPDPELVLAQLDRQLTVLEGARAELETGWVQGGWWSVNSADGSPRLVTGYAAAGGHPDRVEGVCLVGALVRAGAQLGTGGSPDVGRAVDAVYDALWSSRGQPALSRPGTLPPMPPPDVRLARVRTLTQWNDRPVRTHDEVLAVVDRAISATIMDLMAAPRPAQAEPAGAQRSATVTG